MPEYGCCVCCTPVWQLPCGSIVSILSSDRMGAPFMVSRNTTYAYDAACFFSMACLERSWSARRFWEALRKRSAMGPASL